MKNIVILALSIATLCCCTAKGGEKYDVAAYHGDGVLKYKPKAGLLGSDGYTLTFEKFNLSSGFKKDLTLSKLPVPSKGNPFFLQFKPNKKIPSTLINSIRINTTLKDNDGNTVWKIQSTMESWTMAESGDDYYYYWYSPRSEPSFCMLRPDPAKTYSLEIEFSLSPSIDGIPEIGFFYLDAGGFK